MSQKFSTRITGKESAVAPLSRSEINRSIELAIETFSRFGIHLPPFAFWSVEEWEDRVNGVDEINACKLGRDVTDFGSGRFKEIGRTLFTSRNRKLNDSRYPTPKTYAQKSFFRHHVLST